MMKINKACSLWELKAVDEEKRIIEGVASTPTPDRMSDVVEPGGMEFKTPLPFLYQHNSRQPIGHVMSAKVNKDGMFIKAQIADTTIAPWIAEAWALIKARLVTGLSIGFRSLEESYDRETGGFHFLRTEIMEVSVVTIPANQEASITTVKSICESLAALGPRDDKRMNPVTTNLPGASGQRTARKAMRTVEEQIAALEAKRQAQIARKETLRAKADEEGRLMLDTENQEFDGLNSEIGSIDDDLKRLSDHQKQCKAATPITAETGATQKTAMAARSGVVTVRTPADVEKGMAFTRFAMALMASRGDRQLAYDLARGNQRWKDTTPQVEKLLGNGQAFIVAKEAAAAADTATSGWASQLADYTYMASEFIEYLRPLTIIGRIPTLRRVPFNIKVPTQTAGSSPLWVGEGLVKPVKKMTFSTATLKFAKVADIIVLTEELVRFSNPSAEALVRTDLAAGIRQFLDEQFVDPTVIAVADVSPASITNGATNAAASGGTADDFRYDLQLGLQQIIAANIDPAGVYILMQSSLALAMSLMRNDLGNKEFPDLTASGGSLEGFTCVTSQSVPAGVIVIMQPSEIMLADDGGIAIDVSREATVTMDDGVSPAVSTTVNLWQNNLVGIRAEREINWRRRRDEAVYYITAAAYTSGSPA